MMGKGKKTLFNADGYAHTRPYGERAGRENSREDKFYDTAKAEYEICGKCEREICSGTVRCMRKAARLAGKDEGK